MPSSCIRARFWRRASPTRSPRKPMDNVFIATPEKGMTARSLQARLFRQEGVVDAVPEAGNVRVVKQPDHRGRHHARRRRRQAGAGCGALRRWFHGAVQRRGEQEPVQRGDTGSGRSQADGDEISVEVHDLVRNFGDFTAVDHVAFRSGAARFTVCSARTAPGRARRSACCAG